MTALVIGILIFAASRFYAPTVEPVIVVPHPTTTAPPTSTVAPVAPLDADGCSTDLYGGVTEEVRNVGHYLAKRFKITKVVGVSPDTSDDSSHLAGLALDFYFVDKDSGDEFSRYLAAHTDVLDINYVIWWQRVNIDGEWVTMADRGSQHANHYDNVHVSFRADPEHTLTCE